MIEVFHNLLVGSEQDYIQYIQNNKDYVAVIHACKEPYHRKRIGYTTSGAPTNIGDAYYYVEDGGKNGIPSELFLNIIDAKSPEYIPNILFKKSFDFINKHIEGGKVLIHCNKGESRSAGIAIAYMYLYSDFFKGYRNYTDLINTFRDIYPNVNIGAGMAMKIQEIFISPQSFYTQRYS